MSETWTIGELAERARDVLRAPLEPGVPGFDVPQLNGRVRDVPNERLIRWYTTIGLVDPPLARRGRIAVYGRRHLTQLVAVKRRQADGRSIAQIQAELTGATDAFLEAIAQLPPGIAAGPAIPSAKGTRDRFWARTPTPEIHRPEAVEVTCEAPLAEFTHATWGGHDAELTHDERPDETGPGHGAELVHGVRLTPEVALLLEAADRTPSDDDLSAIAAAARPLLDLLHERGLVRPFSWHAPSPPATQERSDTDTVSRGEARDNPDEGIPA